jgi:hypothetical protein
MATASPMPIRKRLVVSALLALVWGASVAAPVGAANTGWDPEDMTGRFDLRWVGVYRQDTGAVRLDISLWDPVRKWMLARHPTTGPRRSLSVRSIGLSEARVYGAGYIFFREESQRWVMEWADTRLMFRAAVSHPNAYLFQVWFPVENRWGAQVAENAWGLSVTSCEHLRTDPYCDQVPGYAGGLDP